MIRGQTPRRELKAGIRCEKLVSFYMDDERWRKKANIAVEKQDYTCYQSKSVNGLMIYPCTVAPKVFTALCSRSTRLDYQVRPTIC
jgi:hypothetical protein